MKKYINFLLKIIVFAFLLCIGVILATSKFDNPLGIKSFVVLTGSMQPDLSTGSMIFTKKAQVYSKGDVIAYKSENVTVTHRIVSVTKKNNDTVFKTKGDANNNADAQLISIKNIYGKKILTIPYIGRMMFFMRTLPGFLILIIIPAMIYIGFEFFTIKKELEKEIEKKYRQQIS